MTREEAIKELNAHLIHWKRLLREKICSQEDGKKTINALDMAIKALEQEPKTGHWINGHCDCCGKTMAFHIGRCGGSPYTEMFYSDYCPNCGVKMESEEKA